MNLTGPAVLLIAALLIILTWLSRSPRQRRCLRWNPERLGYPPSLRRNWWTLPSDLVGRKFRYDGTVFVITRWAPATREPRSIEGTMHAKECL